MWVMMMMIVLLLICPCLHVIAYNTSSDGDGGGGGFQALFVFGDSLLDCGNRRELKPTATSLRSPIIDADHPPYGRDFPTHVPTGRFSNGLVGSDILASFMGLPYPPPYLKDRNNNIMKGCSFASAGAKIVNKTRGYQFPRLNFGDQVQLFAEVQQQLVVTLGDVQANQFLSQSLILTYLGANDYLSDYYTSVQQIRTSKEAFRQTLVTVYSEYIQILYTLGARKFALLALPPLGCIPALASLVKGADSGCVLTINEEVKNFNIALLQKCVQLQATNPDAHFVFLNSFDLSLDVVNHPTNYGFLYGLQPCCLNVRDRAVPVCYEGTSSICEDASEYVFWDFAHPTQALNFLIARNYWEGSSPVVNPINLRELGGL